MFTQLSQNLWQEGKIFLLFNLTDSACLPRSYKSPDEVWPNQGVKGGGEYARLQGDSCPLQSVSINARVQVPIPSRRCIYPIMGFTRDDNSLDIPIPLLPDWIVAIRCVLPSYEKYSQAINEVLDLLDTQPSRFLFSCRSPKVLYRGNLACICHKPGVTRRS